MDPCDKCKVAVRQIRNNEAMPKKSQKIALRGRAICFAFRYIWPRRPVLPDTAEYLARIRSYTESKDPLDLQRQTPRVLAELLASATCEKLTTRPNSDKWSIAEILAHLAEDEVATAWRYRQMVEHSGTELAGFDQDLWARLGDYASVCRENRSPCSVCFGL